MSRLRFAIVRKNSTGKGQALFFWNGKDFCHDEKSSKVYQRIGACRSAVDKVGGDCCINLDNGLLFY